MSRSVRPWRQIYLPDVPAGIRAELMSPLPKRRYRDEQGIWRDTVCRPLQPMTMVVIPDPFQPD